MSELTVANVTPESANTAWFHVFQHMIFGGEAAKMGPHGFMVYCTVKAHVNFATGSAFPSVERIVELTGVSRAQVMRELARLEELGYLTKQKQGRSNVYTLREKVAITGGDGRPVAEASWDYLPSAVKGATAEIRNYLQTGVEGTVVHIEHLTIENLQIINANHSREVDITNNHVHGQGTRETAIREMREIIDSKVKR